ncbi:MAG: LysE family translocator [Burkholderiales bacterium]|nr:LysE family translocator [Burkholderiales bacterium]
MNAANNLWLYFLLVFGVIVLPGMDMAFVMGSSMVGGRRAGFAAVAGIVVGGFCHMAIGATGLSVVLKLIPMAFAAMLLAGAVYLAWIGWSLIKVSKLDGPVASNASPKLGTSFVRAMATCLLNPKAYLFMLAIFPQFVHADRGPIWQQAATLSVITAFTQIAVYGAVALLAAQAQVLLSSRPRANAWAAKCVGGLLIAAAGLTLYGGAQSLDVCSGAVIAPHRPPMIQ